jgi:hypothetical protein
MPRIRRKGYTKRDTEIPISEWSLGELRAELERVETNPVDLNPWQSFKRRSKLQNEIDRRDQCHA